MAQMNLPTKKKQTHGHGEQTCGCQGGWEGNGMDWDSVVSTCKLFLFEYSMGSYCIAQRILYSHLWWNMMRVMWEKECIYRYDWSTLLYRGNWHNIAKQL